MHQYKSLDLDQPAFLHLWGDWYSEMTLSLLIGVAHNTPWRQRYWCPCKSLKQLRLALQEWHRCYYGKSHGRPSDRWDHQQEEGQHRKPTDRCTSCSRPWLGGRLIPWDVGAAIWPESPPMASGWAPCYLLLHGSDDMTGSLWYNKGLASTTDLAEQTVIVAQKRGLMSHSHGLCGLALQWCVKKRYSWCS